MANGLKTALLLGVLSGLLLLIGTVIGVAIVGLAVVAFTVITVGFGEESRAVVDHETGYRGLYGRQQLLHALCGSDRDTPGLDYHHHHIGEAGQQGCVGDRDDRWSIEYDDVEGFTQQGQQCVAAFGTEQFGRVGRNGAGRQQAEVLDTGRMECFVQGDISGQHFGNTGCA